MLSRMALTPKQRKYLKGLAHPLEPVVRVGRGGVTESVIAETVRSLEAHELIKVRIDAEGADRRTLAAKLAEACGADVAGEVGKIAMLYKARAEKPAIKLPA